MFDWKKPTVQMLGRWQPWHDGHQALFKRAFNKTGQVIIQVRDVHGASGGDGQDDNPFDWDEVCENIAEGLSRDEFERGVHYEIMMVPNIVNITYGRGVGYVFEEETFDESVTEISATKIRKKMREEGDLDQIMKICVSEFTYKAFEELLKESFINDEFILIDSEANIVAGEGKPDIALVSYELMFKALKSEEFFNKYLDLIDGCSFLQGSWAGIETDQAQSLINHSKTFSHGGGIHAIPIATYVFAQILRSIKSIDAHIEMQKQKEWKQMMSVGELTDMSIGITGFGGIGQEVARMAKAFRMKVYATKRTPVSTDNLDRLFKPSELNEMLPKCDFVVNCLPSTSDTQKVFSENQFKAMKTTAMFINVGRGESVDEESLAKALEGKEILSAALDTTSPEPLNEASPLWTLENCYITPHDSAWGPRAPLRAIELFVDNYKRFQKGEKLINQV